MDRSTLLSIVDGEISDALGNTFGASSSRLNEQRRKALRYYLGRPMGNEKTGRSKVILTEVRDAIEWIMPTLMRIFMGGERAVVFDPVQKEDEAAAEQATDYCNYVITKENRGFEVLYTWFKDALIQKNGIIKVFWDQQERTHSQELYSLDAMQVNQLLSEEGVSIKQRSSRQLTDELGNEIEVHDVRVSRTSDNSHIVIENVPPEEFLVSRFAKGISINDIPFVAHRVRKTRSELKQMGFKKVEDITSDDTIDYSQEAIERREFDDTSFPTGGVTTYDKSQEYVWMTECYILVDWDGDGIAERRKVSVAGGGRTASALLSNEPWEGSVPFVAITPILMPHRFFGLSWSDLILEIQDITTTLLRQILDNVYLTNNQRYLAVQGQVNLDDLLNSSPGGVVRATNPNAVTPLITQSIPSTAFATMELMNAVKENRTGITRYNQGLDANSLNKTASGISQIMSASQQRIELVARLFAETGVKDLFRIVLELLVRHQDKAKMVRLRNEWVEIDPSSWHPEMDATINVGIGTGDKDQQMQNMMTMMTIQKEFVAGGLSNVVTPVNLYNSAVRMVEAVGLKNADEFFTNPEAEEGAEPQEPTPEEMAQQAEMQKVQLELEKMQMEIEELKLEMQIKAEEHEMKMQERENNIVRGGREIDFRERESASKVARGERESSLKHFGERAG